MAWDTLADRDSIDWAISALNEYGMNASLVQTGAEAREKVLSIIPASDEVMNMTSMTLTDIGLDKDIMESGRYQATRNALAKMDRKTQELEMQRLGAAPPWAIGSVHAVTEDGSAMLASKTGSQMTVADAELVMRGLPPQMCRRADPSVAARMRSKPVSVT